MIGKYARLMLETVQVDKFLQTLGEFWHLNFNRQYQELRERADQQIKTAQDRAREQVVSSFRTVFQVNKDGKLLEERLRTATVEFQGKVSALQTILDLVSAERDQAKGMYGEQFDRASELEERLRNRSVNKVSSRLARMYRATDRSRTPVILSTPNGEVIHVNFRDGQKLIGLNLHTYLIDKQFPPASGKRSYTDVKSVAIGNHVYEVLRRNTLTLGGEPNGEVVRLRKVGLYEHLVHGLQNAVDALYHKREKAKPQET